MAQKYIILGDSLRISANIDFHRDLLPPPTATELKHGPFSKKTEPEAKVNGGGWWHIDNVDKFVLFYRTSDDFGPVTKENLIAACPNTYFSGYWDGYDVYYSQELMLPVALLNKELIFKIER